MLRYLALALLVLSLAAPIFAQGPCNLEIALTCTSGDCTSTTKNAGTNTCAGDYIIGYVASVPADQVTFTNFTNTLGLVDCFDSTLFPGLGEAFALCEGTTSLAPGSAYTMTVHYQASGTAPSPLPLFAATVVSDTDLVATLAPFEMTFSVPVFAPGGRFVGLAVTVTVVPPGGIVPDDGVTVRYGLSTAAVKGTSNACLPVGEGMETVMVTGVVLPTGTTASAARAVTVGV